MQNAALLTDDERTTLLNLKGQLIGGRFQILHRIACGSYSEIYLADNLSPKNAEPQTVIVKVLNLSLQGELDLAMERTLIENLELEALTLGRFRHEHIVRLYECGTGADERTGRPIYYLVLEHMAGGDLFRFCRARPLSIEKVLAFAGQICNALSYAHAHNTAHRDVKPNNILLSEDRRTAKLLDFGTARLLDRDNGLITRVGTAVYSAPEHYSQYQTSGTVTPAADVYSLAKTVLFLLTGESPAHLAQRQVLALPPQIRTRPWALPLLSVLRKATSDRPEDRYQSAQEFYGDLRDVGELTFVGPRVSKVESQLDEGRYEAHDSYTRIEVPVNAVMPRNYGAAALNVLWLLLKYTKAANEIGVTSCRDFWGWIFPRLRRGAALVSTWLRPVLLANSRKLVVRIFIVIAITILLLVVSHYLVNQWRARPAQGLSQQASNSSEMGKVATTSTDVNIRSGPNFREEKVGLAERTSRVRVLSTNADSTWYEIEVLQHGRAKKDPNSADRGWLNKKYLNFE